MGGDGVWQPSGGFVSLIVRMRWDGWVERHCSTVVSLFVYAADDPLVIAEFLVTYVLLLRARMVWKELREIWPPAVQNA